MSAEAAAHLRQRIARLEAELDAARTELAKLEAPDKSLRTVAPLGGSASLRHVTNESPPADKLRLFRERFVGRSDAYAVRWTSARTGRNGWAPAVRGGFYTETTTRADLLPLDDAAVERHLRRSQSDSREFHVGLYPMFDDDRCALLVCDFDDAEWRQDAAAYAEQCRQAGLGVLAEISRSGEGAHVWIFFDAPVRAALARAAGLAMMRTTMERRPQMRFESYDRFFPAQDTLPTKSTGRARLGNLIALPLEGDARQQNKTVFADPETWEPYDDQFAVLAAARPATESDLERIAASASNRTGPCESLGTRPRRSAIRALTKKVGGRAIELRTDALVHMPTVDLPGIVLTELKHLASVANPEFYRRQAQRFSTYGIPRLVTSFEQDETELRMPRGLLDEASQVLEDAGFDVSVSRSTAPERDIEVTFSGELRPAQRAAVDALSKHDTGVLVAPPGSGKTVIACALIAERGVSTAILVNRADLLAQWRARLTSFLSLTDKEIGQLGAGRRKRRGTVDLIMMQSVAHRNADPSILERYGQIIIDECHAVAAPAVEAALRNIDVRRWFGLTATPYRADHMDGLITMQCGPIRHTIDEDRHVGRRLIVHETTFETEEAPNSGAEMQAIYSALAADADRNSLIADEIISATSAGRTSLVLTNRLDHLETLASSVEGRTDAAVFRLHGRLSNHERRDVREQLVRAGRESAPFVLVAMDKVAGEGLDLPTLDTLFLAVPVSFKGRIVQQIGRITRTVENTSTEAVVHDFRDGSVPWFAQMHARRRRVMAGQGFSISDVDEPGDSPGP